jgi:hypothetical protein
VKEFLVEIKEGYNPEVFTITAFNKTHVNSELPLVAIM